MKFTGNKEENIFSTHPWNKTVKEKYTKVKAASMEQIGKTEKDTWEEETQTIYEGGNI